MVTQVLQRHPVLSGCVPLTASYLSKSPGLHCAVKSACADEDEVQPAYKHVTCRCRLTAAKLRTSCFHNTAQQAQHSLHLQPAPTARCSFSTASAKVWCRTSMLWALATRIMSTVQLFQPGPSNCRSPPHAFIRLCAASIHSRVARCLYDSM